MTANLIGDIALCVIIACAAICVTVVYVKVKRAVRGVSREAFHTDNFLEGYRQRKKELSDRPRSVPGMTSLLLPQIAADFPEFNYNEYKSKAESLIHNYLAAIEEKAPQRLNAKELQALAIEPQVKNVISELDQQGLNEHFDKITIHDTQIANYLKKSGLVTVQLKSSVGFINYADDKNGNVVYGSKELRRQTVFCTDLTYVQDIDKIEDFALNSAFALNCPNCGAPITSMGQKYCDYCGSAVKEINIYCWRFTRLNEEGSGKRIY